jgi:probable O-glycosylation ligase (exosortase A-associated)
VSVSADGAVRPVSTALFAGLLAIFWIEYIRPGHFVPLLDEVKLNTLVPLAVVAFTVMSRDGRPTAQVLRMPDTRIFLALTALFVVQFFVVDVRLYVFEALKAYIGYLLVYYVLLRHAASLQRLSWVMATLVLIHVVTVILYPDVILDPVARHELGGTFLGDGNDFAWSTCLVLPFTLFLAATSRTRPLKVLAYAAFVLLVLAVIGTQSRGGTLGLLLSTLYLALKSRNKVLAVGGIAVVAAVVAAFAPDAYFQRLDSIAEWRTEGSAQGRILAWKSATEMALDHPVIGVGAGHYGVKFGFEYKPRGYHGPYLNTHSIYFVMLAEFGFPGLILLLMLLLGNAVRNHRLRCRLRGRNTPQDEVARRLMDTMQASLLGYAVAGAFLSGVFYPHLFVLTAMMGSARYVVSLGLRTPPAENAAVRGGPRLSPTSP